MSLERSNFISRDPEQVEVDLIARFESEEFGLGRKLYPAQPERLLVNNIAYRETLLRLAIQYTGEQNLVNYAEGVNLDQLGALLTTTRLPAQSAITTLQFTKDVGAVSSSIIVPSGTRAQSVDGAFLFATTEDLLIGVGISTGSVTALATVTGTGANGYTSGQIASIVDPVAGIASVSNTTTSQGGAAIESDANYRERIKLAPEKFSVAGSEGAYRFYTLQVNQSIIDAAITNPSRVTVNVYPLLDTGLPSSDILNAVNDALQPQTVRPLTDIVNVLAPTEVTYTINASVTLLTTADQTTAEAALNAAAQAYAANRRAGLGRDIVRAQIVAALASVAGVYNVTLSQPASDTVVAANEWANCTSITITIGGTAVG